MMVRVILDASARLRATSRNPHYATTDSDLPGGLVELACYPRIGDFVGYDKTGNQWTVQQVYWGVGSDTPVVVLD